jgi:hypothetical protein
MQGPAKERRDNTAVVRGESAGEMQSLMQALCVVFMSLRSCPGNTRGTLHALAIR